LRKKNHRHVPCTVRVCWAKKKEEEDEERRERERIDGMSRAWGVNFKWEQAEEHLGLELKLKPGPA